MHNANPPSSRTRRLGLVAVFVALTLALTLGTTFTLYRQAKTQLDRGLGEQLKAVSTNLARVVAVIGMPNVGESAGTEILAALSLAESENNLSNIALLDPEGLTIIDLDGYSQPGELNPFIDLDLSAVTLARSGVAAYTALYRSGDIYLKSAYAPVVSEAGTIVGLLSVEAGAQFFDDLRALARLLGLVTVAAVAIVFLLGVLFYVQSMRLDRASAAAVQQENLATLGRMVANIAHEIRNPLSIISTSAQRLQKKVGAEEETLSFITEEVDQLDRILTGYLEFARDDVTAFTDVDVDRLLERSVAVAAPAADKQNVAVTTAPGEKTTVWGDERRLRQALINVIINAVQASTGGGSVVVDHRVIGGNVAIRVTDHGIGMSEKQTREAVKPFFTNKVDGSGLGLSIVKTIVEQHRGNLEIRSKADEGTAVTLTLPRSA